MRVEPTALRLGTIRAVACLVLLAQGTIATTGTAYQGQYQALLVRVLSIAFFCAMIGYCTRWSLAIAVLVEAVLWHGAAFDLGSIAGIAVLAALACSPAGDGFSVDALALQTDQPPRSDPRYGYSISVACGIVALALCCAVLAALGFALPFAVPRGRWLILLGLSMVLIDWPAVGNAMRRLRPVAFVESIRRWLLVPETFLQLRVAMPPDNGLLLWDGACSFCARMLARLQRFGARPVAAQPFQEYPDLPDGLRQWTGRQMHWVMPDGGVLGGSRALIAAVRATGRPSVAAMLDLRVTRPLTWLGYHLVAANRDRIGPLAGATCVAPHDNN